MSAITSNNLGLSSPLSSPEQILSQSSTVNFGEESVECSSVTAGELCPRAGAVVVESTGVNDPHSYSRPWEVKVTHMDIKFFPDFEEKILSGSAKYTLRHLMNTGELHLDCKGLEIDSVIDNEGNRLSFTQSEHDALLGYDLTIQLHNNKTEVTVSFKSSPNAEGLYWDSENKTVFSHSQPTYTRSWLPCQDSPSVRTSYTAQFLNTGSGSLMSCQNNPQEKHLDGVPINHEMKIPIPSYLIAFAVTAGFEYRATGPRTGIYASSDVIDQAFSEYSHLETILQKAEELFGPYGEWGRYDMLIFPAKKCPFPASATENPCLTFFGPAILSGDGANAYIVYHELAHSWSGNYVTAASWEHLWMNEGLTSYWENRLTEHMEGPELAALLLHKNYQSLLEEFKTAKPEDQCLRLRLKGRNPRDSFGDTAYYKGMLFFKMLEHNLGRERFDTFMKQYFAAHKYKSVTTEGFEKYLTEHLLNNDQQLKEDLKISEWLYQPGVPQNFFLPQSAYALEISKVRQDWLAGGSDEELMTKTAAYNIHEWRYFIMELEDQPAETFRRLEALTHLKTHQNMFIRDLWIWASLKSGNYDVLPDVQKFVLELTKPITVKKYVGKLVQIGTSETLAMAKAIYEEGMIEFSARARTELELAYNVRSQT